MTRDAADTDFEPFPAEALEGDVAARFEAVASRRPDRPAIVTVSGAVTYGELNRRANGLARAILDRRGPGAEPVVILAEHDTPAVVAILAALKAGKIFVPLDPREPAARLADHVAAAQAGLIVAGPERRDIATALAGAGVEVMSTEVDRAASAADPGLRPANREPAAIYFTSGTSGEPKGIVSDHRFALHRVMEHVNSFRVAPGDRLSLLHAMSSSASFRHLFGALLSGATLLPFDIRAEGVGALAAWIDREQITMIHAAASVFRQLVAPLVGPRHFPSLRLLWVANEPVFASDVELYRAKIGDHCTFVVGYAISEAGTVCHYTASGRAPFSDGVVPVGDAVVDKEVLILDEASRPLAVGEVGEIAVRSEILAIGYWRRPALTRRAFVPDPDGSAARVYRTGDVGRLRPDGCLEHLGRKDGMPKLRGLFVDVIEVERTLLGSGRLLAAAVTVREDRPGDQRLVAYVVPHPTGGPSREDLRRLVSGALPTHMVPSIFTFVDTLPRTPNGKLDRRALPAPERSRPDLEQTFVEPATPIEREVARIWAEALDLDRAGLDDDFVALGGHSLLGSRIMTRLADAFGLEPPLRWLADCHTVRQTAAMILRAQLALVPPETAARVLDALEEPPAPRA